MSYTVFENQNCSGTRNTRLKQHTLFFFLLVFCFFIFLKKWYKQQYKIVVLLTVLQKKVLLTRQLCNDFSQLFFSFYLFFLPFFLFCFFPLSSYLMWVCTPESRLDRNILVMRAATQLKTLYGFYGYRTLLSNIKRHMQKAPSCTVYVV